MKHHNKIKYKNLIKQLQNKHTQLKLVFDLEAECYREKIETLQKNVEHLPEELERKILEGIDKKELKEFNNKAIYINSEMGKVLEYIEFLKSLECEK